jgi:RimJ/RimL family protein N-acetyltransferase
MAGAAVIPADWCQGLPELAGERVTLRELRPSDADALSIELGSPDVQRFMSAPPSTAEAFSQFIAWARGERGSGALVCYGIVPADEEHAAGVFELRPLQSGFARGELGFVMASRLWGRGLFSEGARLVLEFAFRTLRAHRIEVRTAVDNTRGNAALQKLGASREGRLRAAFLRGDHYVDQYLWSILDTDRWGESAQPSER